MEVVYARTVVDGFFVNRLGSSRSRILANAATREVHHQGEERSHELATFARDRQWTAKYLRIGTPGRRNHPLSRAGLFTGNELAPRPSARDVCRRAAHAAAVDPRRRF